MIKKGLKPLYFTEESRKRSEFWGGGLVMSGTSVYNLWTTTSTYTVTPNYTQTVTIPLTVLPTGGITSGSYTTSGYNNTAIGYSNPFTGGTGNSYFSP